MPYDPEKVPTYARPGSYNWTQFRGPLGDGLRDRMDRGVLFELIVDDIESLWDELDTESPDMTKVASMLGSQERQTLDDFSSDLPDVSIKLQPIEIGRGAGAVGLAVELLAAAVTLKESAQNLWRCLPAIPATVSNATDGVAWRRRVARRSGIS